MFLNKTQRKRNVLKKKLVVRVTVLSIFRQVLKIERKNLLGYNALSSPEDQ